MDSIVDHLPCFIISTSEDGTLFHINQTAARRLEYSADELAGKKIDVLLTLATRIFQQTHLLPLLKLQGFADEIFISMQTRSGAKVPVLINAKRMEQDGSTGFAYIGMEVQNRTRFEEELIAARNAAEQALQDNSALSRAKKELEVHLEALAHQMRLVEKQHLELLQLNKVITHDLQEPLRKMSLFGNMLLNGSPIPVESVTERLMRSLTKMSIITSGLQQYVWLNETSPKLTTIDPGVILSEEITQLNAEFPDVKLHVEARELQPVIADKSQMHILFYQLLSNVVRFRKPGTAARAKLVMHTRKINSYRSMEGKYKYTDFVGLELHDNGIGLKAHGADKAFELFRRLHNDGGTGLGLALCRKIVEMHHGEISISGTEGEGATVTILLPLGNQEQFTPEPSSI